MTWNKRAVRELRESLGLTQSEFAQELGCRQQTVSEWELGLYAPANAYGKLLTHLSLRVRQSATFSAVALHPRSENKIVNLPHEYNEDSVDKAFDPAID